LEWIVIELLKEQKDVITPFVLCPNKSNGENDHHEQGDSINMLAPQFVKCNQPNNN